jgi:hypothetical protein
LKKTIKDNMAESTSQSNQEVLEAIKNLDKKFDGITRDVSSLLEGDARVKIAKKFGAGYASGITLSSLTEVVKYLEQTNALPENMDIFRATQLLAKALLVSSEDLHLFFFVLHLEKK